MNKNLISLVVVIVMVAAVVVPRLGIKNPIKPQLDPEIQALSSAIHEAMKDNERASEDSAQIAGCLRSASNLFIEDSKRDRRLYKDQAEYKNAINRIGSITVGLGWIAEKEYPKLAPILDKNFDELGDSYTLNQLVEKLNKTSEAFDAAF